ncbi:hypothetical protein BS78_09G007200 [Paspalum vaginatum]|nr:hypothetical protein BS78_09G007200 [Paspalum vaginatum]KAJ1261166.1 hypothetical protein BS78_09G007200 [Paspalum vaginatum]KAJ1261167.1 hypothetical protein BS78_09G007200 [Paspalum vaginatum]
MKALKRLFCKAAKKVINDSLYNARITTVCHYYKFVKGEKMTEKKGANRIYLKAERYQAHVPAMGLLRQRSTSTSICAIQTEDSESVTTLTIHNRKRVETVEGNDIWSRMSQL